MSIFKAYDIRGIYPSEIDSSIAEKIGAAYIDYLGAAGRDIAVGRDIRHSSPEIAEAFIEGARNRGANVVDLGIASTDQMYYAVGSMGLSGGAIVTASHNPREYNGIKLVREGAIALSGDAGIREIRQAVESGHPVVPVGPRGSRRSHDVMSDYVAHCRSFIDEKRLRPMKVVVDAGNGMGGWTGPHTLRGLPIERIDLFFEPDGDFPNHPADPLVEENRRDIVAAVRAHRADLGIAWDGDADRCFFIDDEGEFVPGDFVTALLGEVFVTREPGARIVYDVRASRAVADRVRARGGVPVMHRVGHAFMKVKMRELGAIYGGEVSAHYYFRENWFADNGTIPALLLLELLGVTGMKLSELLRPLRETYFISGEINSKVASVGDVLERVADRYSDGSVTRLDGVSVDYDTWHFNVRGSNTEPLIRLNLEATSRPEMERKRDEVLALIRA